MLTNQQVDFPVVLSPLKVEQFEYPLCIFSYVFNPDGKLVDLRLETCNPAFSKHVNSAAKVGSLMSSYSPAGHAFWIKTLGGSALKEKYTFYNGYRAFGSGEDFSALLVFPAKCLQIKAVCAIFINDAYMDHLSMCLLCKSNNSMRDYTFAVEDDNQVEMSNCDFCLTVQDFIHNGKIF